MVFIIAHRGFSSEAPENTLASIKKAIDIGVDYIEIDIHLTKDHIPVVIHDPNLERTTGGKCPLKIEDHQLATLNKFDIGSWYHSDFHGELLPTLEEVLDLDFKGAKLMIEIKKDLLPADVVVPPILKIVKNSCNPRHPIPHYFGSFDLDIIKKIREDVPTAKTIGILEESEFVEKFLDLQVHTLAIWVELLNQSLVNTLQAKGVEIFSFTVNSPEKCQELISMGVDGIISDNPRMLKQCIM